MLSCEQRIDERIFGNFEIVRHVEAGPWSEALS